MGGIPSMFGGAAVTLSTRPVRKSWHFAPAEAHSLHDLLSSFLDELGNSALILVESGAKAESPILAVRAERAADLATLPSAAALCQKYVKLRDRDIALLNDPSSGGTTLSEFTLVAGAAFETAGPEAELLLVKRISLPARISESGKIDAEGVRVPPMPIAMAGQINTDILSAMSAHPLAPQGLSAAIQAGCADLLTAIKKLKAAGQDPGSEFRRANFKRYLADCSRMAQDRLHHLPLGAKTVSQRLPTGELLKLQLRIDETRITFDFAGTESSTRVSLTEMMTFGACMAVTASLFADGLPMNAATFSMIQVSAPSRTLLSGQGPVGSLRSTRFVLAAVCDLVRAAFAQLNSSHRGAGGATVSGHYQFEFSDGKFWSGTLEPGSPARADADGLDAYALWEPKSGQDFSMEQVERDYPLRVLGCGIRTNSGGRGLRRGGDGAFYSFECLAPVTARWALGPSIAKADGIDGGKSGTAAKIEVRRKGSGDLTEIPNADGSIALNAGDQIHFFGAGGGAFGSPPEDDAG